MLLRVGRIQFLEVAELVSPSPCWLSAEGPGHCRLWPEAPSSIFMAGHRGLSPSRTLNLPLLPRHLPASVASLSGLGLIVWTISLVEGQLLRNLYSLLPRKGTTYP